LGPQQWGRKEHLPRPAAEKRGTENPAITESLMEDVCERENYKQPLKRLKANKGSAGVDGMTVQQLLGFLQQHWPALSPPYRQDVGRPISFS
jgi:RNA-directed DNA polymerase